jgi:hypothetical protein
VEEETEEVHIGESKISKTLSEKTVQTVIILILGMLFILPFFDKDTYGIVNETSYDLGLRSVKRIRDDVGIGPEYDLAVADYISTHLAEYQPLILLKVPDKPIWKNGPNKDDLRVDEYESVNLNNEDYVALYDARPNNINLGIINIVRTIFICFLLSMGAI